MKITIITAVYNRVATIDQALASVAAQTHDDVEHIIVDGASTDGTLAKIHARRSETMQIISEPDQGIYDALNKGVAAATGDVVGLMHSDDFFAHDDVLSQVAARFAAGKCDAVYGDLDYISATDPAKIVRHWASGTYSRERLKYGWMPPHPALFVTREVLSEWGGYDTTYQIAADYDAILRWFWTGQITASYIPEVLVKMRVGGESNRSLGRLARKSREDYRALRSNDVGGIGALAWKNLSKIPQFLKK